MFMVVHKSRQIIFQDSFPNLLLNIWKGNENWSAYGIAVKCAYKNDSSCVAIALDLQNVMPEYSWGFCWNHKISTLKRFFKTSFKATKFEDQGTMYNTVNYTLCKSWIVLYARFRPRKWEVGVEVCNLSDTVQTIISFLLFFLLWLNKRKSFDF